ncbi:LytS family sensor histidine kinase [Sphingobacterium paludis]|uniref:Histidine kinase n=1 Tax=Sphingobacterium paludis TaxID=1476465 RepID=A0A4R7CU77_9SPHI|nr:hypothetical protein [Sphingobacterium paludis]TDS06563.1 hypothetical protein B0I21_1163 [Sphingobacterium paludis]
MTDIYLRFRSGMSPLLHLASWIIYLYTSYCLNESKYGTGSLVVLIFPLYAVTFYSIYFFLKYLIDFHRPLHAAAGLLMFLISILPITYFYINLLLPALGVHIQDRSVPFRWSEFIRSTYLGVFRIGIYALIAYLITLIFKGARLLRIFKRRIRRLKFGMLGTQLTSHTQYDLLHKLMGRFAEDREKFEQYVEWLADIQGYTATSVDRRFVPLASELEQTEHLALMLQPTYFSDNPDWLYVVGDIDKAVVPPMMLVMLVENACKYTDFSHPDAVKMTVQSLDDVLHISCVNTIGSIRARNSLGLGNTILKARLEALFGREASHRSFEEQGRYTVHISMHFKNN